MISVFKKAMGSGYFLSIPPLSFGAALFFIAYTLFLNLNSYDRWIPDHENVYRIDLPSENAARGIDISSLTPPNLATLLEDDKTHFKDVTRLSQVSPIKAGPLSSPRAMVTLKRGFADPDFTAFMDLEAVAGHPADALSSPDTVVVTVDAGTSIFGRSPQVGDRIILGDQTEMLIGAVIEDVPPNSHMEFDILLSMRKMIRSRYGGGDTGWRPAVFTYVRTRSDAAGENGDAGTSIQGRVQQILEDKSNFTDRVKLAPVTGLHFDSQALTRMKPAASRVMLWSSLAVALIALGLGVTTYGAMVALRLARSARRYGVEKLFGLTPAACTRRLAYQGVLAGFTASIPAVAMAVAIILPGGDAMASWIPLSILFDASTLIQGFAAIILTTSLAGVVTAKLLADKQPASLLGTHNPASLLGKGRGLKFILFAQIGIAYIALSYLTVVFLQLDYSRQQPSALPTENRWLADLLPMTQIDGSAAAGSEAELSARLEASLADLRATHPSIVATRSADLVPSTMLNRDRIDTPEAASPAITAMYLRVDPQFHEFADLRLLAGRFFSAERRQDQDRAGADYMPAAVLSESARRSLGFETPESAIGAIVNRVSFQAAGRTSGRNYRYQVIGVVDDKDYLSTRSTSSPVYYIWPDAGMKRIYFSFDSLRAIDQKQQIKSHLEKWFDFNFNDIENLNSIKDVIYSKERSVFRIISFICILILSLTLLVSLIINKNFLERKRKEIGIRIIMGANKKDIYLFLFRESIIPLIISIIMFTPFCYIISEKWISQYTNRFELGSIHYITPSFTIFILISITLLLSVYLNSKNNVINILSQD